MQHPQMFSLHPLSQRVHTALALQWNLQRIETLELEKSAGSDVLQKTWPLLLSHRSVPEQGPLPSLSQGQRSLLLSALLALSPIPSMSH